MTSVAVPSLIHIVMAAIDHRDRCEVRCYYAVPGVNNGKLIDSAATDVFLMSTPVTTDSKTGTRNA